MARPAELMIHNTGRQDPSLTMIESGLKGISSQTTPMNVSGRIIMASSNMQATASTSLGNQKEQLLRDLNK